MVRILTDSAADFSEELARQLNVEVLPLGVTFEDGMAYRDRVDLQPEEFYEKLAACEKLPKTSQPNLGDVLTAFENARDAGDEMVAIFISSQLSGTYQSACIAAEEFPGKVFVVDSQSVAVGSAILAEYALELAKQGLSAEEIAWKLLRKRERVQVLAMLDTLEYLMKGGRISKTAAIAGSLLSIKPVVTLSGGEIKVLGKARGSRQANNLLVQEIAKAGGVDFSMPLLLGYTGLSDILLQKYIADSAALWEGNCESLPTVVVGSVVGTHAGPGAVAVAFFAKDGEE